MRADPAIRALALCDGRNLYAVAAYRLFTGSGRTLCRNDLLAVSNDARRRGFGIALKSAVVEKARAEGAQAVDSIVDARNSGMISLNLKLGAVVDVIDPADPEYVICVIPV